LAIDFRFLQVRLVSNIQARVRNGELTERHLAHVTGVSQPHIHNVLKGIRLLSLNMADQILHRLRMDLADLMASDEISGAPCRAADTPSAIRNVPLLVGDLGPGQPYPSQEDGWGAYPFPAVGLEHLQSPVAARLAPDPGLAGLCRSGDVVLLERAAVSRENLDEDAFYAVDLDGDSAIRRGRRNGCRLDLLQSALGGELRLWRSVSLVNRSLSQVVRARVCLMVLKK
jgi:hypothetical protein